jgi:hypothetical protein
MKKPYYTILLALSIISCQKILLPAAAENSPVNNFEEMWQGYKSYYGLFKVKHIDWDSMHAVYRTKVHNQMSETELYALLCALIKPLNDPHVFLQPTSQGLPRYESSVFFRENKVQREFSIDLVRSKYLPEMKTIDQHFHYGILPGNTGYIHFNEFGMPISFYKMQLDKVIDSLKSTKALIMDIRDHAGGDDEVSRYVAGRFASSKQLFMTTRKRNGPNADDFTSPVSWYVQPGGSTYTKPVALLTTRWTTSAGETFTWAMNTQPQITQIGDTTAGGFSDVTARELPNGWLYFISVGDYRDSEGNSREGQGIPPKEHITNTAQDIADKKDRVLEAALQFLDGL